MSKFTTVVVATLTLAILSFVVGQATRIHTLNCQTQFGLCDSKYTQALSSLLGQPLLFVNLPKSLPFMEVKDLTFARQLPFTLSAKLTLRRTIGALISNNALWLIGDDGGIVAQTDQTTLPLLRISITPAIGSHIDDLSQLALDILSDPVLIQLNRPVGELSLSQLIISSTNGPQLLLDVSKPTLGWQAALQSIIARSKINGKLPKIIDLRYPSPIVTYNN